MFLNKNQMTKELLILDQDGTLVQEQENQGYTSKKIISGAKEFLAEQSEIRECIIATSSSEREKEQFPELKKAAYFGSERLSIPPSSGIRKCNSEPSPERPSPKNIKLIKQILSAENPDKIHSIMIGNYVDLCTVLSDTETPLIVVGQPSIIEIPDYQEDRETWLARKRVRLLLNCLFHDEETPKEIFDQIFNFGEKIALPDYQKDDFTSASRAKIFGHPFILGRQEGPQEYRAVFECPQYTQKAQDFPFRQAS